MTINENKTTGDTITSAEYNTIAGVVNDITDNGVIIVSGSVTGDFTVDTNTLHVDSINDRVGIGTDSPARHLHINSGGTNVTSRFESTDSIASIEIIDNSTTENIALKREGNILSLNPGAGEVEVTDTFYSKTEIDNGNSGTSDTLDFSTGNYHKSTLTGNVTFTFTAPNGSTRIQLKLIQDATGSRTVTWPGTVVWPGGTAPTLSTAANSEDIVTFYYDGTNYYGVASLDFQ